MSAEIETLYRTHGPMVLRRCRRLLRDEARALDAMHDVFVELLKRKDSMTVTAPAGLLLTIATNVCLNRLRSERRRREAPPVTGDGEEALILRIADETSAPGAEGNAEDRSLARRVLDRWLGREPASTQLIAVLHFVDRLTLDEVAAEVGLSVSGVRKRLRGLKERLPVEEGVAA